MWRASPTVCLIIHSLKDIWVFISLGLLGSPSLALISLLQFSIFLFVSREFTVVCWCMFMMDTWKFLPDHFICCEQQLIVFSHPGCDFPILGVMSDSSVASCMFWLVGYYTLGPGYIFPSSSQSLCLGLTQGSWLPFTSCSSNENVVCRVFSVTLVYLVQLVP